MGEHYDIGYRMGRAGKADSSTLMEKITPLAEMMTPSEYLAERERGYRDGLRDRLREEHKQEQRPSRSPSGWSLGRIKR